jgi:6-phosphogluconolactonase
MKIDVFSDDESTARAAAKFVAAEAATAVATRGQFVIAISGGRTPWVMLRALGNEDVPWEHIHILQVDERVGVRDFKVSQAPGGIPNNPRICNSAHNSGGR